MFLFFFFKQKTAYEMRISDWSSDVCSSDLLGRWPARNPPPERRAERWALMLRVHDAVASGASHRAIAECLFDLGELPRWRVNAPSWRRRVQRLAEAAGQLAGEGSANRSEEHTDELQSLMSITYAVFCLKKKRLSLYNKYKQ